MKNWFMLEVVTNKEKGIVDLLEKWIYKNDMEDVLSKVKFLGREYKGYVFLYMEKSAKSFNFINGLVNVRRFVKLDNDYYVLNNEDILRLGLE